MGAANLKASLLPPAPGTAAVVAISRSDCWLAGLLDVLCLVFALLHVHFSAAMRSCMIREPALGVLGFKSEKPTLHTWSGFLSFSINVCYSCWISNMIGWIAGLPGFYRSFGFAEFLHRNVWLRAGFRKLVLKAFADFQAGNGHHYSIPKPFFCWAVFWPLWGTMVDNASSFGK